jgi:2-phosphosulfolactate phosphatase
MPRVVIDFFPSSAERYARSWTVVAVDVFRATTTACTAVACGRRCFPVASAQEAFDLATGMGALLAGEQGGLTVDGFDMGNSPADMSARTDIDRPVALLTSSGTALLRAAAGADTVYAACLRNTRAQAARLLSRRRDVAVIGAGTHDEVRMEDEMACARVAQALIESGYIADARTRDAVSRWSGVPVETCANGRSAAWLRETGQERDIDFVVNLVDDLDAVFVMRHRELVAEQADD